MVCILLFDFQVDIAIPEVFIGGLLGSMLIFLFSAWACSAVGRTAQEVVKEVRRQFIERPGIMVSNYFSPSPSDTYSMPNHFAKMEVLIANHRTIKRSLIMVVVLLL